MDEKNDLTGRRGAVAGQGGRNAQHRRDDAKPGGKSANGTVGRGLVLVGGARRTATATNSNVTTAAAPSTPGGTGLASELPRSSGSMLQDHLSCPTGCGLSVKSRALRPLILGLGRGRLARPKHRPHLAAHVDQMKAASRQFAEGHGVPGVNRRESMRLHVTDFMKVSRFEMLHRVLHRPHGIERDPIGRGERLAQFAAAHHEMLPCTNRNPDDAAAQFDIRRRHLFRATNAQTASIKPNGHAP
jgi:hypothetical protein